MKPLVFSFLAPLLFVSFLSSCGSGSEGQQKEVKQHRERTTPLNEEVDEVRALQARMQ